MLGHRLLAAIGIAAAVSGLGVVLDSGLAAGWTPTYVVVLFVGVFALVRGLRAFADGLRTERRRADLPTVERRAPLPAPGEEVDDLLAGLPARFGRRTSRNRSALRERLREAALSALERRGHSRAEARDLLASGAWTDDPRAAAFFRSGVDSDLPLGARVGDSLAAESAFGRRARHAVDAIAALSVPGRHDGSDTGSVAGRTPARDGDENGRDDVATEGRFDGDGPGDRR